MSVVRLKPKPEASWAYEVRLMRRKRPLREPCCVCSGFKEISAYHHLLSIKELKKILSRGLEIGIEWKLLNMCSQSGVWLCPNHHAILHFLETKLYSRCDLELSLGDDEKSKLYELMDRARTVRREFLEVIRGK